MIGMLVKLAILVMIGFAVFRAYRRFMRLVKGAVSGGAVPFAKAEECPSCRSRIRVPAEPGSCPRCGTSLGRSPDGKLLIKVN